MSSGNQKAVEGTLFVCGACGKTSPWRYGFDEHGDHMGDPGWDESCSMHAVLCRVESILKDEHGRAIKADAVDDWDDCAKPIEMPEGT